MFPISRIPYDLHSAIRKLHAIFTTYNIPVADGIMRIVVSEGVLFYCIVKIEGHTGLMVMMIVLQCSRIALIILHTKKRKTILYYFNITKQQCYNIKKKKILVRSSSFSLTPGPTVFPLLPGSGNIGVGLGPGGGYPFGGLVGYFPGGFVTGIGYGLLGVGGTLGLVGIVLKGGVVLVGENVGVGRGGKVGVFENGIGGFSYE